MSTIPPPTERAHAARIEEYYRRVDSGDVDWLGELFAEGAKYNRAGQVLRGRPAIVEFYQRTRKISGKHHIHSLTEIDNLVVVEGEFIGIGADGSERRVCFADLWRFSGNRVESRASYLSVAAAYVTE